MVILSLAAVRIAHSIKDGKTTETIIPESSSVAETEEPDLAPDQPAYTKEDLKNLVRWYAFHYEYYEFNTPEGERCLDILWDKESGWQLGILNRSSHAAGLPQSLPPTKIYPDFHNMEREYRNGKLFLKEPDAHAEISWGIRYIHQRYGNPCAALRWHRNYNWY